MKYWTEKEEYSNMFDVKTEINGVIHNIGMIERPYNNEDLFIATGWNNETLSNEGSWIFRDFEAAKQRIISHYEREMEVLNK